MPRLQCESPRLSRRTLRRRLLLKLKRDLQKLKRRQHLKQYNVMIKDTVVQNSHQKGRLFQIPLVRLQKAQRQIGKLQDHNPTLYRLQL